MSQTASDNASPNDDVSGDNPIPPKKRTISLVKRAMVVAGVCAVGILAIVLYTNLSRPGEKAAALPSAPPMKNVQGATSVTPLYAAQVRQVDQQNYQAATANGQSSFPLPVFNPTTGTNTSPQVDDSASASAPPALDTVDATKTTSVTPAAPTTTNTQFVTTQTSGSANNPYTSMLGNLLGSEVPEPNNQQQGNITFVAASDLNLQQGGGKTSAGAMTATSQQAANNEKYVPAPGTLLDAEMINGLNSDAPGPAFALVKGGPLNGARVIGRFTTDRAGLVLEFTTMTVPIDDGQSTVTVPIQADAISETGDQVEANVDNHFLENAAVTFIAGFGQGMGTLLAQSGSTTVNSGNGSSITENPALSIQQELGAAAGGAAGAVGNQFQQTFGNRPPTITIQPGTQFTLAFLGSASSGTESTGGVPLSRIVPSVGGLPADTATVQQETPISNQNSLQ